LPSFQGNASSDVGVACMRAQGFDAARWDEFRHVGQDLCAQLVPHAQKEEMALLPVLDENMDAETEARLYENYVENA
jgi:hypothetical protein